MSAESRQNKNLTLIEALARGCSQSDAARQAGVSQRTVSRRLECQDFRRHVETVRSDLLNTASGKLTNALSDAIDTLSELMKVEISPRVRLAAARAVIENCCKLREIVSLESRIELLERLSRQEGGERFC